MPQLPLNTKIAGRRTVEDLNTLKVKLADFKNNKAWEVAFRDFYYKRLEERYLNPIASIKEKGRLSGEGFAIMAIICSLVEFLESTYQGKNYRYRRRGDPQLTPVEYDGSEDIFISFLTNRTPFSSEFDIATAVNFYKCVRCGLLHEARTKGKWKIKGSSTTIIKKDMDTIVVYRNSFLNGILVFIKGYEADLYRNDSLKEAFIRKFDNLCAL